MPLLKSNLNNDALIDDRRPEETWENFLNEFPGAAVRENDIDRVLAALFDAPFATGRITADEEDAPGGSRGTGETDPLRLFPAAQPARAVDALASPDHALGALASPDHALGTLASSDHALGALSPAGITVSETTPAQRRAMLAALAACIGASRQNDTGALFTQSFLPVYRREMANAAGAD